MIRRRRYVYILLLCIAVSVPHAGPIKCRCMIDHDVSLTHHVSFMNDVHALPQNHDTTRSHIISVAVPAQTFSVQIMRSYIDVDRYSCVDVEYSYITT